MRPLRVMGLADSGKSLVCEDPSTGEQFSLACDDRLRAGARGDLSRFGQLEIELESQLRPREIQSRIRAGASVEQVATEAGITVARVERFAYPVLQERASVVTKAIKARPAIDGITARASVAETVAASLSARGHDGAVRWDAFKDEDGWVLSLTWNAGRSENRAHWLYHPGADGGTLSARDDAAAEIVDPALRILRPLRPVRPDSAAAGLMDPTVPTERPSRPSDRPSRPAERSSRPDRPSAPTGPASRPSHPAGSKLPAAPANTSAGIGRDRPAGPRLGPGMQPRQGDNALTPAGSDQIAFGGVASDRNGEHIIDRETAGSTIEMPAGVSPVLRREDVAMTGTDSAATSVQALSTPKPGPGRSSSVAGSSVAVQSAAVPSVAVPSVPVSSVPVSSVAVSPAALSAAAVAAVPRSSGPVGHPTVAQAVVASTTDEPTAVASTTVASTTAESATAESTTAESTMVAPTTAESATISPGSVPKAGARPAVTPAATRVGPPAPKNARRGQRPAMPSWEDVLLGTRSTGH